MEAGVKDAMGDSEGIWDGIWVSVDMGSIDWQESWLHMLLGRV